MKILTMELQNHGSKCELMECHSQPSEIGERLFDSRYLRLSEKACSSLIEGCNYGRNWVNSDFLWKLAQEDPELWVSYEYFEFYEKAVSNGWGDIVSKFRAENRNLEKFCDFFERGLQKNANIVS